MKTVYIDNDYKCHTSHSEGLTSKNRIVLKNGDIIWQ